MISEEPANNYVKPAVSLNVKILTSIGIDSYALSPCILFDYLLPNVGIVTPPSETFSEGQLELTVFHFV
jgi:hypothetical protein